MAQNTARNTAPDASLSRGDETRGQLLDAGLTLFSRYGYDSVTTRQLASEAGANIAAIAYHFGGKRDLYRAVLHQLVEDTEPLVGPVAQRMAEGIAAAGADKAALARVVAGFVHGFTGIFLEGDFMAYRAPMVMREFANPSEDFDILYEGRLGPIHRGVTALAAAALDMDPDSPEAKIRAHAVMGSLVVFEIAQHLLMRRTGWEEYTPDRIDLVRRMITEAVLNSLRLPHPDIGDRR